MFGGGSEIVNASLKKLNVYGIPAGGTGAQMGAWFKKEINTVEDLKGLRIRIGGMGGPIFAKVGVVPYEMAHADVYCALESGTIDGAEFLCPHDDEKLGIAKLAKIQLLPVLVGKRRHACIWVVNLEKWNALPKSYQAIVARACDAAKPGCSPSTMRVNPPALKRLVAAGAVIRPFPQPVLEACYKAANEYFAELAAKDAQFKRAFRFGQCLPQGAASLVADRRACLRQHIAQYARAGLRRAASFARR